MPAWNLKDAAAVCGVGHTVYGRKMNRSQIDLAGEAIRNALDDAGLERDDLDGLIVSFGTPIGADADTLAYALGLKLRAYNQTWAHGRFTASSIQWAASDGQYWYGQCGGLHGVDQLLGLSQTHDGRVWRRRGRA